MRLAIAFAALLLALGSTFESKAAPGDVDFIFDPGAGLDGDVLCVALQSDGRIVIGGNFRNRIARLHSDGRLDSSFNVGAGASGSVNAIALQPDGKIVIGGLFTSFNLSTRRHVTRLHADGTLDSSFNTGRGIEGPFANVYVVAVQADGKILVGGEFSSVNSSNRHALARLNSDGTLDTAFASPIAEWGVVRSIVVQSDGKIIAAGLFRTITETNFDIVRLNSDGSLDPSFNAGSGTDIHRINVIALQPDGKVLLGGRFDIINGISRNYFARLNADGSVDHGFVPHIDGEVTSILVQPNGRILVAGGIPNAGNLGELNPDGTLQRTFEAPAILCVVAQPDGKILAGGETFEDFGAISLEAMVRLNPDGTLDPEFLANRGFNAPVSFVHPCIDGKVLVAGEFTLHGRDQRNHLALLNTDGRLDGAFNVGAGPNAEVESLAVGLDSKVMVSGKFTMFDGVSRNRIARLNSDGSLDPAFDPGIGAGGASSNVHCLAVEPDGGVMIGGAFSTVAGVSRNRVARLNSSGTLDAAFDPGSGANGTVWCMARDAIGKVLVGGEFTHFNGSNRSGIVRLNNDGSLDHAFDPGPVEGFQPLVSHVLVQPDGRIIVAGNFTNINGFSRNGLARLNANGSLDITFDPGKGLKDTGISALAVQANGKVVLVGNMIISTGSQREVARLNADGSLDSAFSVRGVDSQFESVRSVALDASGKILVGGSFFAFNGIPRWHLARLVGDSTAAFLSIRKVGAELELTWEAPGFALQAAPAVGGSYTNVPGAASPYRLPGGGLEGYFRLEKH